MLSPFPGMDLYLKGSLGPDVHLNKREPGLSKYHEKSRQLHAAEVHILEMDVLRRGQRLPAYPRIPPNTYRITLIRAVARCADIWSLHLQDALLIVPISLS